MILALETSTKNCSVALIEGETLKVLIEEHSDQYIHSEKLHLFIEDALKQGGIKAKELQAIAVGAGPGSYTGLRIGVASAKALAYSLKLPLISAKGSELLFEGLKMQYNLPEDALVHTMIDARRMEVYLASFDCQKQTWSDYQPFILEEGQFDLEGPQYFIGDGAAKAKALFKAPNHHFPNLEFPSAAHFTNLAARLLRNGQEEDVAYFEPFYLKDFIAHRPKSVF